MPPFWGRLATLCILFTMLFMVDEPGNAGTFGRTRFQGHDTRAPRAAPCTCPATSPTAPARPMRPGFLLLALVPTISAQVDSAGYGRSDNATRRCPCWCVTSSPPLAERGLVAVGLRSACAPTLHSLVSKQVEASCQTPKPCFPARPYCLLPRCQKAHPLGQTIQPSKDSGVVLHNGKTLIHLVNIH